MATVGASCEVHLMLRGMVDVGKELAKLEEKIEKLDGLIAKMKKSMSIDNYEEKVSRDRTNAPRLIKPYSFGAFV